MSQIVRGVVRAGKIELIDGPELAEGQHVQLMLIEADQVRRLSPGEEVVIIEDDRPVARLVCPAPPSEPRNAPRLGTLRGTVLSMEHFDDPLDDFKEYTE